MKIFKKIKTALIGVGIFLTSIPQKILAAIHLDDVDGVVDLYRCS